MLRGEQEGTSRRWLSAQPRGRGRSWHQARGLHGADSQHVCGRGQPRAPPSRVRGALAAASPPAPAGAQLPACRRGDPNVCRALAPSCTVPTEHQLCLLLSLLPLLSLAGGRSQAPPRTPSLAKPWQGSAPLRFLLLMCLGAFYTAWFVPGAFQSHLPVGKAFPCF